MKTHVDDRRTAFLEVFRDQLPSGNLNVTWVHPGAICAWHRHQQQDDHMLVLDGILKVGTWEGDPEVITPVDTRFVPATPFYVPKHLTWTVLTRRYPQEFIIPRGLWHGYKNIGTKDALVLTYITQPYNKDDEERLSPSLVNIDWSTVAR